METVKRTFYEIIAGIVAVVVIIILVSLLVKSCSDKSELQQSNSALFLQYKDSTSMLKRFRTLDGLSGVSVKIIQASKSDLKKSDSQTITHLQNAGVNVNEITSIGKITASVNIDSIKWSYQNKIDSLAYRCAFYSDSSLTALICMKNDSITQSNIYCPVPLFWATSDIRKKLWFITLPKWLFGIKERRFTITTTSKYVDLKNAEFVFRK